MPNSPRRVWLLLLALSCLVLAHKAHAQNAAYASRPSFGINLSGIADWNTELPFNDQFKLSRQWISQREGAGWGQGPELALDANGWVQRLEDACWAETLLMTFDGGHAAPQGTFHLFYDGQGTLELPTSTVTSTQPGHIQFHQGPGPLDGLWLRLKQTNPNDPIRNIRCTLPGVDPNTNALFREGFLNDWRGVSTIRFMDWMDTNNSKVAHWDDRPKMQDASWTKQGVPLEAMLALANELDADPWFCMPHRADDAYIRQFAEQVKATLKPDRKVYVEYSNEVWNGMFEQSRYAGEQGQQRGLAQQPWEAGWLFTAERSLEVFAIWQDVFGGTERLIRILPTQAANPYIAEQMLKHKDTAKHVDALAIAPYFGPMFPAHTDDPNGISAEQAAKWPLNRLLQHVAQHNLPESLGWVQAHAKLAKQHGLALVAYEAGQHLVGVAGGENNEQLTALLHEANRSPAMGRLFQNYLKGWQQHGGGTLAMFASTSRWSKWGSWGLKEFWDQTPAEAPKFQASWQWGRLVNGRLGSGR